MGKLGWIVLIETLIILILAIFLIIDIYKDTNPCNSYSTNIEKSKCFLSPRIYTGMLPSDNKMIFNYDSLKSDIQTTIASENVSVYVLNMRDGASFGINSTKPYPALSLNKLPLAMIIMKKIEFGNLSLDTLLPIRPEDRDSTSGTLYSLPVEKLSVKELLKYMLQESDNTATRVFGNLISVEDLQNLAVYLDFYTDNNLVQNWRNNAGTEYTTTPKDMGNIFLSLYLSTILKPESSSLILSFLTNTSFDINKYASLPKDIIISQKYGLFSSSDLNYFHSCGIMYIKEKRIFYCVMTSLKEEQGKLMVGKIVNKIYTFFANRD